MSVEQLDIEAPALPDAFVSRWRALEQRHGIPRAGLAALSVDGGPGCWWIVVRVDGRTFAVTARASLEVAAEDVWQATGRP